MLDELVSEITTQRPKKVLVQLPEGLKMHGAAIAELLKKHNIECIISGDPCYGACDIKDEEALQLGCDLLVHVGHSKFYKDFKTSIPVLYFPWIINANLSTINFSAIKEKRIGILTPVQHLELLNEVKKLLQLDGKNAFIGGQVLGCNASNAEKIRGDVDAFLFVGSGTFHALALNEKPVYVLDLEKRTVVLLDSSKNEKIRWARIFNAKQAKTFAVLVSSKKGQFELQSSAEKIKANLESHEKKAFIVVMNEISESRLLGIKADAFINTACPRIADDTFSKPFVNAIDIKELFE